MAKIVVPVALFCVIGFVIFSYFYLIYRTDKMRQVTLQKALNSGEPMSSEFLSAVGKSTDLNTQDFRRGVILNALGFSVLLFGILAADLNPDTPVAVFSVFPFSLGIAYLLVW
jgi:hypothetical protein